MATNEQKVMVRWYFLAAGCVVFAVACLVKLYQIQSTPTSKLRAELQEYVSLPEMQALRATPARRGNIFSSDGRLLAISHYLYKVSFDPTVARWSVFNAQVGELSRELGEHFGLPSDHYEKIFRDARRKKKKYIEIASGVDHHTIEKFRNFHIFRKGRRSGGYREHPYEERVLPMDTVANRTIGEDEFDDLKLTYRLVGLEGSYGIPVLKGESGKRWMQRIQKGQWKPMNTQMVVDPEDGQDLVSTIDMDLQNFSHKLLLEAMTEYEAERGCLVVMEVKTGKVRAIVNLGRRRDGRLDEIYNYAVGHLYAPGSTFKAMSLVAALESGKADTSQIMNTTPGVYVVRGDKIRDSKPGGYGLISLGEAFVRSSNTAFAKLIDIGYEEDEKEFMNQLAAMKVTRKLGVGLRGEPEPLFRYPGDPLWTHHTLPWMAFGYEIQMTPLQVLAFYNAIATEGMLVRPSLVEAVRDSRNQLSEIKPDVIERSIFSKETARQVKDLMRQVVQSPKGTGYDRTAVFTDFAGKTGTSKRPDRNNEGQYLYSASFAGYFPVDQPEYSAIVYIDKPNKEKGYYGGTVAMPVFRGVAHYLSLRKPAAEVIEYEEPVEEGAVGHQSLENAGKWRRLPDFSGLPGIEAIQWLEDKGIAVEIEGSGKVLEQSVAPETPINEVKKIRLKLS